jgi:hypothetical protein
MADGGLCRGHHAIASKAGFTGYLGPFPVCDPWLSLGQRQCVHQRYGLRPVAGSADRTDQVRARKSNDNGLVESKNGAVIRKHMGYGYIAAEHAQDIHAFYRIHFNPYLNFHRPCGQPQRIVDQCGKEKFVYKRYATPWETLRRLEQSLPPDQSYLQPTVSIAGLDRIAQACSDTEAARRMQEAKRKLFLGFRQERKSA